MLCSGSMAPVTTHSWHTSSKNMSYGPCAYRVSVKAVIVSSHGLLLVKEDSEYWDLPGGGVEHFEDPEDTLRREIAEETGAKVTEIRANKLEAWFMHDLKADRPLLFLIYPVKTDRMPQKSPNPDIAIGYFSQRQLKSLAIEPHLEKYRHRLIELAGDSAS